MIVDDGSFVPLIEADLLHDSVPIRLIRTDNSGQSAARNVGAKAARGEYISFLDQDDYFHGNHIENLVRFLCAYAGSDWSYTNFDLQTRDKKTYQRYHSYLPNHNPIVDVNVALTRDLYILPSAILIKKTTFEAVGGFNQSLQGYEDDDFVLRLIRAGHKAAYSNEASITWIHSAGSSSNEAFMDESRLRFLGQWLRIGSRYAAINLLGRVALPFLKRGIFKLSTRRTIESQYFSRILRLAQSELAVSKVHAVGLIFSGVFLKIIEQLTQRARKMFSRKTSALTFTARRAASET